MKEFFADRLVRAVFAVTGLIATVGGPVPTKAPKLQAFKSNGCSIFPDGDTYGCCYVHDMKYWAGGTAADRRKADRELQQCAADVTPNLAVGHAVGGIMYAAVTIFGAPGVPTRVKWGYGWDDTRQIGYNPLTSDEQSQVDAHKKDACATFIPDPETGRYMIDGTHWLRPVDVKEMCPAMPVTTGRR